MTSKQKLASQHNWHKALILGNTGSLIRICYDLGLSGTAQALKGIQTKMVKENQTIFVARRSKL